LLQLGLNSVLVDDYQPLSLVFNPLKGLIRTVKRLITVLLSTIHAPHDVIVVMKNRDRLNVKKKGWKGR
jgi:hypothetical protein